MNVSPTRAAALALAVLCATTVGTARQPQKPEVIVVGAGIAGLSAALDAADAGVRVTVVDMWSVFGGHAVMSQGGVCIVGSPVQQAAGVADTPDLAFKDFVDWGEDPDRDWVRFYVDRSRDLIYDWVTAKGITFDGVVRQAGNSVARFHETRGRGLGLVSPIYRDAAQHPRVTFVWNMKVTGLLRDGDRVVGVVGDDMRSGERRELRGSAVVLATGGFQSNLEMVRTFWPASLPFPERILVGSGLNSTGSGHDVARSAGAALVRMDHQWNYSTGLPDPRYAGAGRGLNAHNTHSIWVNAQGRRFVNELASDKFTFPVLVGQRPATYWAIFDEAAKKEFWVSGSDWGDFARIEREIFARPELVKTATTIEQLAEQAGLPASTLLETVRRYNQLAAQGNDSDFGRFSAADRERPATIGVPPFYAVQFFPLTRKSMGGVSIDRSCRVLDGSSRPIAGLYAAGELTGLAGINGRAGLEGTFLGPSIVTGRVAGRRAAAELGFTGAPGAPEADSPGRASSGGATGAGSEPLAERCAACHDVAAQVASPRRGYSHFEKVHRVVGERKYDCARCHAEMWPFELERHRVDRVAQIASCRHCHVADER
jgi:flavocytochrome c